MHMFEQLALHHKPEYSFQNGDRDFPTWKNEALPKVLATLGEWPEIVQPNPQLLAEWMHDGLRKQRWLIDVSPYASVIFQVNYPGDLGADEKRPAILAWHGHGEFGKEPVMGNDSSEAMRSAIATFGYNYGHEMAKAGFVTFAIDWMAGGERNDSRKPNYRNVDFGRDWCNLYYLLSTMLGMTSLSVNLAHGKAATDFACSLPHVDGSRLGVMGLSGGGTMTTWTALTDERFKAVEIICYSDLWEIFGFRDINICGMQVSPGLYKLVDLPDLQGLIAPRPLLIDIGIHDTCFKVDGALACYHQVEKIYEAAGVRDKLELDLFPGEHMWAGNKSRQFFKQHLMEA
jgi:hypothetical protein